MSEPAGWYGNPDGTQTQRYWDGAQWTHNVRPVPRPAGIDPTTHIDPAQFETTGPVPDPPHQSEDQAPATADGSASVADLLRLLFDLGMDRSIGPALVRTAYRIGAFVVLVVAALLLIAGLLDGGFGAIVALVAAPLGALVLLIVLRFTGQLLLGESSAQEGTESG